MNIIFMGTPDFAKESLEKIYNEKHNILAVVTNIDKKQGRGMKISYTPVKEFALEKDIKIFQPQKVRNDNEFIEEIKKLNPDVIVVVAYGKILPKELLDIPKYGCINVHGSLLPKYRGAAPIQWAVLNGDKITGITTMFMDEGMDTGDMILKEEVEIGANETTGELWDRLSIIGADLLVKTLDEIKNSTVKREKQPKEFTHAPMLSKDMAKIDWSTMTAQKIHNLVRGLNPIMGAYSNLNSKKIKFWKTEVLDIEKVNELQEVNNFKSNIMQINNYKNGEIIISNPKIRTNY